MNKKYFYSLVAIALHSYISDTQKVGTNVGYHQEMATYQRWSKLTKQK